MLTTKGDSASISSAVPRSGRGFGELIIYPSIRLGLDNRYRPGLPAPKVKSGQRLSTGRGPTLSAEECSLDGLGAARCNPDDSDLRGRLREITLDAVKVLKWLDRNRLSFRELESRRTPKWKFWHKGLPQSERFKKMPIYCTLGMRGTESPMCILLTSMWLD